ncbi:MAG: glycogen debranching enzyme N-terminal domain-containing protein [Candidatus Azobacteroides pseudotrichonymphae]|jgi:predicted glycogen debranching enzyme|nr:amylo-alpha-1,6-glucosidase [Bacteroidales bacterium OttesenSCG-928-I14]GMO35205.1 MAG: glycogen debranching enzyme N-terminal domain-containing protein [Candidatus Azobacteroides pseudotrichonymphae]
MGYLKFDKTLLINLEESLQREILCTNRKGAYHSTTVIDCNTRKYHGMLICPVPKLDSENHVLLSSLDVTVIQHRTEFNLGIHQYAGRYFNPSGQKYLRQFEFETVLKTTYRVGGVILNKEKVFTTFENRILIKYTLLDAHSSTVLRFRPFLAFRSVNALTYANPVAKRDYTEINFGIKTCMYDDYPDLYMQFNKKVCFVFQPNWYKNIEYSKELERGLAYKEDLYVPGYFELSIEKGESIYFSASDTFIDPANIVDEYNRGSQVHTPRTSFYNCLKNSAQQFYYHPTESGFYLLAGYPWFKVRARDLFISMPGCSLAVDDPASFEKLMDTAMIALRRFMRNGNCDKVIQEIYMPDVLLWAIWALQEYAKYTSLAQCSVRYGKLIQNIIQYIMSNKHPILILKPNGLLYANGKTNAVTWMNSTFEGKPILPRSGYIVEFNALWFNALKFSVELSRFTNEGKRAAMLEQKANQTESSFVSTFVNKYGYLYDYVDEEYINWSVRPNMLFAISLDYSPLSRTQKRSVLNIVTRELLTPKGIRSLSPRSEGYRPYCTGYQHERDLAYHQGTVWPWLLGVYLEAYLKLYQRRGVSFIERMLIGLDEEMNTHCISSLSELFDGNPPFQSRGAISFAMNVASILHVLKLLDNYNNEK